jgi:lipoprotein-anchoring transpeptidase ErfK/SrfK
MEGSRPMVSFDRHRELARGYARGVLVPLALVLALAAQPMLAWALAISAPADVTGPVDVEVRLEAGEAPGTVTLTDRGSVLATSTTSGGTAGFAALVFSPGAHQLQALLAGRDGGAWTSAVIPLYSWGVPEQPRWVAPASGRARVVSPVPVKAQAGASTATLTLTVNGAVTRSVACSPGEVVDLGAARLVKGTNVIAVTATSLTGASVTATRAVARTEWPYDTCIVIDKSDYRLYWIKGQQLVAAYKIAHGRNNWTPTRTWKILAKYKTDPRSVYGPRKMRLFKRVGSPGHYRYVFTRYAIHGTNQPGSIGHQASHGCIRMYSRDVLQLWPQVRIGTYVVTRP